MSNETVIAQTIEPTFAYLIIRHGDRVGKVFQLRPDVTNIGRLAENHIRLDEDLVSGAHARIRAEATTQAFVLHDLASTNGTKVNGDAIDRRTLQHDDEVVIGSTTLVFKQL